ncbi:MAG TPA: DUF3861 domain-containing protein [Alphaproteobacteria bacterium]|nr:DUF3861 domain-containing protein [Alphaproteobacteria bacterium]
MALRQHRYRITVEHLASPREDEAPRAPLAFEAANHDEIISIAERVRGRLDFPPEEAAALAIGMKLFGEVMLAHRDDPLFAELRPAWRAFIATLKARRPAGDAAAAD